MIRILGRNNSGNVQKLCWLADELGLDFVREDYGASYGNTATNAFAALNPNRTVPVVIDGDFVLWESNACLAYLAARYGAGAWYPDDLQDRARAARWMDWTLGRFADSHVTVFHAVARTAPVARDEAKLRRDRDAWSRNIAILDRYLAEREFLAGDRITIGDLPPAPYVHRWFALPIEREDYPNVRRWYDEIAARPAFRRNVADVALN